MENNFFILSILFYFIGSVPFAYILPKIFGFGDIRKIGSGNVGATNVLRTGNKVLAFVVLFFDAMKGFLPFYILKEITSFENFSVLIFIIGSLTIVGHLFPIWLKFKGGKGVATYIGYLFAINHNIGIIFIFCWIIIAIIKRYSSLSSIISLLILPFVAFYLNFTIDIVILLTSISFIIIIKHYANIIRLFNKTENKIRF